MKLTPVMSRWRLARPALVPLPLLLAGCNWEVLAPAGDIAAQQRNLLVIATLLMLVIIVPVIVATLVFAWRYRAANRKAQYEPDWDHSTQLELLIWAAPLLIIICLGAITWSGTHLLDPYRPLGRITRGEPVPAHAQPLRVEVVAMDWKWLFIYPGQGVAAVNELVLPVNRPVELHITASSVMNAFYAPSLAGMIYAMPAMETRLHAVLNFPGEYDGFSANYSGAGFSGMRFKMRGVSEAEFATYIESVKAAGGNLDRAAYLALGLPGAGAPQRARTGAPLCAGGGRSVQCRGQPVRGDRPHVPAPDDGAGCAGRHGPRRHPQREAPRVRQVWPARHGVR
jgi:cytochrome o ubiquinol oxidase subunit II